MRIPDFIGRNMLTVAMVTMGIGLLSGCGGGSAPPTGTTVEANVQEQQQTQNTMEKFYADQAKAKKK